MNELEKKGMKAVIFNLDLKANCLSTDKNFYEILYLQTESL